MSNQGNRGFPGSLGRDGEEIARLSNFRSIRSQPNNSPSAPAQDRRPQSNSHESGPNVIPFPDPSSSYEMGNPQRVHYGVSAAAPPQNTFRPDRPLEVYQPYSVGMFTANNLVQAPHPYDSLQRSSVDNQLRVNLPYSPLAAHINASLLTPPSYTPHTVPRPVYVSSTEAYLQQSNLARRSEGAGSWGYGPLSPQLPSLGHESRVPYYQGSLSTPFPRDYHQSDSPSISQLLSYQNDADRHPNRPPPQPPGWYQHAGSFPTPGLSPQLSYQVPPSMYIPESQYVDSTFPPRQSSSISRGGPSLPMQNTGDRRLAETSSQPGKIASLLPHNLITNNYQSTRSLSDPSTTSASRLESSDVDRHASLSAGTVPATHSDNLPRSNLPVDRSDWVMWVGNVPYDATQDELWQFFSQFPGKKAEGEVFEGIISINLIAHSRCAFVDFKTEAQLLATIFHFDGKPLRPDDSRCPQLVCRVRTKQEDLNAGVGGQRRMGIHTNWVRDQKAKMRGMSDSPIVSVSPQFVPLGYFGQSPPIVPPSSDVFYTYPPAPVAEEQSTNSSASISTNSDFLFRHFPERYFILKSSSESSLDLSVRTGLWTTQEHNESILDQAYRTSRDIYLFFGVNRSREFYGYARLTGPVLRGEPRLPESGRMSSSPAGQTSLSTVLGDIPQESINISILSPPPDPSNPNPFFPSSEHRLIEDSPLPEAPADGHPRTITPGRVHDGPYADSAGAFVSTAPSYLSSPHRDRHWIRPPRLSLDPGLLQPASAATSRSSVDSVPRDQDEDALAPPEVGWDEYGGAGEEGDAEPEEEEEEEEEEERPQDHERVQDTAGTGRREEESAQGNLRGRGNSFKVQWIRTTHLPFDLTRNLRNPWNRGRLVKISRDGTELEPSVGKQLLEAWESLPAVVDAELHR